MPLRPATMDDAETLFAWRNDPETRRQSRDTEAVQWDEHVDWLRRTLEDPDRLLLVAESAGDPVGTIRFDRHGRRAEVSVTVSPAKRGESFGSQIIEEGTSRIDVPVDAWVKSTNTASIRTFESAGYVEEERRGVWVRYTHAG